MNFMRSLIFMMVIALIWSSCLRPLQRKGVEEGIIHQTRSSVVCLKQVLNFHISQLFDRVDDLVLWEKFHHRVHKVIKRVRFEFCNFFKHLSNEVRKFSFFVSAVVNERKARVLRLLSKVRVAIHRARCRIFHLIVANDNIESLRGIC